MFFQLGERGYTTRRVPSVIIYSGPPFRDGGMFRTRVPVGFVNDQLDAIDESVSVYHDTARLKRDFILG